MVELEFVRTYHAPRQLVWEAWTDPDQLAQWWGPRGVSTPRARKVGSAARSAHATASAALTP